MAGSRTRFEIAAEALTRLPIFRVPLAPRAPNAGVTAIELPYRLIVSPIEAARFAHSDLPVEKKGRTELWHSRLSGEPGKPGPDRPSKIRALWSPDYPIQLTEILKLLDPLNPYRMSLDPLDRQMLVQLMAGYDELTINGKPYTPRASRAQRLMLSALGGLLDAEGNWSPSRPAGVGLEQWRHLATLGRDHYVRVVYAGFLMPFGHAASLIKVTERKFENGAMASKTGRVTLLRQRFFIVVREPVKTFSGTGHAFGGRNFPFTQLEIITRVTPNLMAPDHPGKAPLMAEVGAQKIYDAVPQRAAFWPLLAPGADFRFAADATDLAGNRVSFAMPLAFIGVEANQARAAAARASYNAAAASRRTAPTAGASVCFAPIKAGAEGDPRLPTASIVFASAAVSGVAPERPQFYPEIESAQVGIQSVQRLLGREAAVGVKYPDVYKQAGFGGANPGEVFLQMLADFALEFGESGSQAKSDALGALATPALAIQGLSRIMGPAGDLAQVVGNKFDPAKFFKDAKILGGIPLASLLDVVTALAGSNVPKMLSRDLPDRFEASFTWKTEIKKSDPLGLFVPGAGGKATRLDMRGVVSAPAGNPAADRTKKEIRIHTKLPQSPLVVEADRSQVEQVLLNIYVNAWQAMPDGGELYIDAKTLVLDAAFCRLHQNTPGRYHSVSIADTGIGMDEDTQLRIFDPFFTTKEKGRGTGLGLASAYGIIKNHGGMITVEQAGAQAGALRSPPTPASGSGCPAASPPPWRWPIRPRGIRRRAGALPPAARRQTARRPCRCPCGRD